MKPLSGLPSLRIEVGGAGLAPALARALVGVRVQQRLSLPSLCELAFAVPSDRSTFSLSPGLSLRIALTDAPLFVGELTAIVHSCGPSGERQVRARGYDALHRLRKRRPVRAHVKPSLLNLVNDLTSDLGVVVQANNAVDSALGWKYLIQDRQSDFEFMKELTERCGVFFSLREGTLHLLSLDGIGESIKLVLGESLLECSLELSADSACRTVSAHGWHPGYGQSFKGKATLPRSPDDTSDAVAPTKFGADGERTLVDQCAETESQLDAVAQAELDRGTAAEVTFGGVAIGNRNLVPGARVEILGVAEEFARTYVITSVDHTIDASHGFVSELSSTPPLPTRQPLGSSAVTVATVTDVQDPEKKGRVRVKLLAISSVETDWMQVMSAGAGSGKGWTVTPDVDDRVVVLLAHGDPAQGVVIGGIYGELGPTDSGVDAAGVQRYSLLTRSGHKVRFDDENKVVRIESSTGSFVELAPTEMRLHAAADLVLEAPGKAVVIRGNTIDFQRG